MWWRACVLWRGNRPIRVLCVLLLLATFGTYHTDSLTRAACPLSIFVLIFTFTAFRFARI